MENQARLSILFVCMGNICRSPTAQGVVERLLREQGLMDRVLLDSAGTHAYHLGKAPDPRTQAAASARGYDLSAQRARQVTVDDFRRFDRILAMDRENLRILHDMAPPGARAHTSLFLALLQDASAGDEVPDPYYGNELGFERVLDLVEAAGKVLIEEVRYLDGRGPRPR